MFYLKPYKAIKKPFKSQDEFELKCSFHGLLVVIHMILELNLAN